MKLFREIIFWLHLCSGVVAGIVVFIMSITGVALTYEKQMLEWADLREYRSAPPSAGAAPLPLDVLLEGVRAERGATPSAIVLRLDPADPVAFSFGREATVYVNPYSGAVLGEGGGDLREFFQVMVGWHRWLGREGEGRTVGRAVTGACNLAFLVLVVSGFYLWWPRKWRWSNVKNIVLFRGGLGGKARDFNWHNVIGFWSAIPLFVVVASATVISYPWASNLVYRTVGEEPPARRGPGGPGRAAPGGTQEDEPEPVHLDGVEALVARAAATAPGWKRITLNLPPTGDEPLRFSIDQGSGGQPQLRSTLTLDRATGETVEHETFADGSLGRRMRSWLRFLHTGEAAGLAGQTIAGVVSAGAAVLVYTGLALSWRRFLAWIRRRRVRDGEGAQATAGPD